MLIKSVVNKNENKIKALNFNQMSKIDVMIY